MNIDNTLLTQKMKEAGKNPTEVRTFLSRKIKSDLTHRRSTDLSDFCDASGLSPQYAAALYQTLYDSIELKGKKKGQPNLKTGSLDSLDLGEGEFEQVSGGFKLSIDPKYTFKVIMVSDTHLASRHDNIEGLEAMFEHAQALGVKVVLHSGDVTDGFFRRHADMYKYLRPGCMGFEGQYDYVVSKWPKREGITTYMIAGNHDHFAQDTADADILRHVALARRDMVYLKTESVREALGREVETSEVKAALLEAKDLGSGRVGAIRLGPDHLPPSKRNTIHLMLHPGDGSGLAISYKPQRIMANIDVLLHSFEKMENAGGKRIKPHSLQIGHYHKSDVAKHRNVWVYQSGTMKLADEFHEVKNLHNMLGYWVVEYTVDRSGDIIRMKDHFQRPHVEKSRYTRTVAEMLR